MPTADILNARLASAEQRIAERNEEKQMVSNLIRSLTYYRDSLAAGDATKDCPAWVQVMNDWRAMAGRPDARQIQDDLEAAVAGKDWEE